MRVPFMVVAIAWFATMAGANLATPLYAVYEREFGFSSAVLTAVFATYMVVLAPALLVFGQLSDRFGRRRVMAAGFATATLGLLTFAAAQSLPWLFAARSLQGVAVGMVAGAAAAALVELDPARHVAPNARRSLPCRHAGRARRAVHLARPGRRQRLRPRDRRDAGRMGSPPALPPVRPVRPLRRRRGHLRPRHPRTGRT